MIKKSAGIILYKLIDKKLQVLLVHPGGPFWAKKDVGAWSIPKGELEEGEDELSAAKREVLEEINFKAEGEFIKLTPVKQKAGKIIYAWAFACDVDILTITSNNFEIEWPPKSGQIKSFPEVDKALWFYIEEAKIKINAGQKPLLSELESILSIDNLTTNIFIKL